MHVPIFYKWFLYFFTFTSFAQVANAQYEEKEFVHYTVKEGLSDNYITCLQQDDRGYIWAGTNIGLNRFDGNQFSNFFQGHPSLPLASNDIRNLKKTGPQQLGIIGGGGLQLLNTKNLSVKHISIPDSTALYNLRNATWDAIELPGHSYALTTASGFYIINNSGNVEYRYDAYNLADIGKKRILFGREIFPLNDSAYLVYAEQQGLFYYNAKKKIFRDISSSKKEWGQFLPQRTSEDDHWVVKQQLNQHKFIFVSYRKDSIILYDHALKLSVNSPLPFHSSEFNWESKITMLNDSVFAINATSYGFYLFHLNKQNGKITSDGKRLLPSFKINQLFFDKDKRLWAGTSEGLLQQKLTPPLINSFRFQPASGDIINSGFTCTYAYKNRLYAGRYSMNTGLLILDPLTMQVQKQINFYGGNNPWNEILSMEMYHPDTLWIGTSAGILWLDTKTAKYGKATSSTYNRVASLTAILAPVNKDGFAWICNYLGGLVLRYHVASRTFTAFTSDTRPRLPFDKVKAVVYDSYGDVWIAGHSLTRWNSNRQLFDTVITSYAGENKFNDDIVTLVADNNGSLWVHNASNGLLEYRIKEKLFVVYGMKEGLPSNVLQSFSPVIENNLWIGSNSQLSKFDTRTKKFVVFDQHDGLPGHKPSGRKILYDGKGSLYMCAGEYIVKIAATGNAGADNSSNLLLQELTVNDKHYSFDQVGEIKLNYNENNLSLSFTLIDFEKSNYHFAYKFNEAETWNNLGNQRSLNLNNLQPGKYFVQLKATGKSGNEKITIVKIVIKPPFWKTPWFLFACGILLTAILYYLYIRRIKQVRKKADIDKMLAQTEMKALHSQMNPHFIFNSLNSIKEMILNNENKEASHYLSKFAQLIRITLDQSEQSFVSLRNTLDYLQRYIEMEKIRNSDFTYLIKVDREIDPDETLLPPMLIQPFIENAIWHGVSVINKKIHININFKKQGAQLVCSIEDNGVGIKHAVKNSGNKDGLHKPVGISNIRNRIRVLNEKYNLQSDINILDKGTLPGSKETGTLVTLYLPLEINEEWIK